MSETRTRFHPDTGANNSTRRPGLRGRQRLLDSACGVEHRRVRAVNEFSQSAAPACESDAVDTAIRRLEPSDKYRERVAQSLEVQMAEALGGRRQVIEAGARQRLRSVRPHRAAQRHRPRAIVLCSLSFASALYFIVEFDNAIEGQIRAPSSPMRDALQHIDAD